MGFFKRTPTYQVQQYSWRDDSLFGLWYRKLLEWPQLSPPRGIVDKRTQDEAALKGSLLPTVRPRQVTRGRSQTVVPSDLIDVSNADWCEITDEQKRAALAMNDPVQMAQQLPAAYQMCFESHARGRFSPSFWRVTDHRAQSERRTEVIHNLEGLINWMQNHREDAQARWLIANFRGDYGNSLLATWLTQEVNLRMPEDITVGLHVHSYSPAEVEIYDDHCIVRTRALANLSVRDRDAELKAGLGREAFPVEHTWRVDASGACVTEVGYDHVAYDAWRNTCEFQLNTEAALSKPGLQPDALNSWRVLFAGYSHLTQKLIDLGRENTESEEYGVLKELSYKLVRLSEKLYQHTHPVQDTNAPIPKPVDIQSGLGEVLRDISSFLAENSGHLSNQRAFFNWVAALRSFLVEAFGWEWARTERQKCADEVTSALTALVPGSRRGDTTAD